MLLPERQRGAALLILLALFATAAAYMLVSSLSKSGAALTLARFEKNRAVMQEAKAALIAWAASQALTASIPGALPCPDRDNDGIAEATCSSANRLGRLPYKTLGIGELRDASGELLWYGLSGNFRNYTGTVNSDTQGTITVSGLTPATNVVAVVLAPGARLDLSALAPNRQDRSPAGTSCNSSTQPCNIAANYLEDINGDTNTNDYIAAAENLTISSQLPYPFNDQLLVITQQDLLSIVEPVVAARIQRDIVRQYIYDPTDTSTSTQWSDVAGPNKSRYFDAWGSFPFAATFANPGGPNSIFTGQATPTPTYEGLLPVVSNLNYAWSVPSIQTGGAGTVNSASCSATTASNLICSVSYHTGAITIRMSGTVSNVGLSFVQLPRLSDVSPGGGTLSLRSLSGSLNSAGEGIVVLDATLPATTGLKTVIITISSPITSPLINPIDPYAGWFNNNEWYKQTYYAVSPGYAPGGAPGVPPCVSPVCLSVNNLAPPKANPTTDTRALIILAGRSLSGASRPNGNLSDYLEAKNASTGDYSFEHGLGKTTTVAGPPVAVKAINDRVIVIAP